MTQKKKRTKDEDMSEDEAEEDTSDELLKATITDINFLFYFMQVGFFLFLFYYN